MELLLPLLVLVFVFVSPSTAIYCQRPGYSLGPSFYCFKAFQSFKTFDDAQRRCEQDGALLSKSDDDYNFVDRLLRNERPQAEKGSTLNGYWLGGHRDDNDRFRWLDGTRVDPPSGKNQHWIDGEPNNYFWSWQGEDCLMTYQGSKAWNDIRCSVELRFVCQMDSIDPCNNSPCKNNGACRSTGRDVSCICPMGFTGDRCQRDIRPCTNDPCQNGGQCRNVIKDNNFVAECLCPPEYEGRNCEKIVDPCAKVSCANGGACVANGLQWTCVCPRLFTGTLCETSLLPCELLPCKNGAICENVAEDFMCFCKDGYEGKTCEEQDACFQAGTPCTNGGQCVKSAMGAASCSCPAGYAGAGCEEGPCHGSPCQNGGACAEKNGDFFCDCAPDFSGRRCTKECPAKEKDAFPQKLDIIFLLDGSGSVGRSNYKKSLEFVDNVIAKMKKLGPNDGRVGYVQFAGKYKRDNQGKIIYYDQIKKTTEIRLGQSAQMKKAKLRSKIASDKLFTTFTRTGDALSYVLDRFNTDARMDDPKVAKYLMVLTDGKSTGQSEKVKVISDRIWAKNITTFAIGVGRSVSQKELNYISHGESHHKFMVNNFDKLNDQFIQTIIEKQCYVGPCEKLEPCKNGGKCIEYDDNYSCECPFGKYTGVHCEKDCKDVMTGGFPDELDAFFLLDGSGSIEANDEFAAAKGLVAKVLMKMNIAQDKQRVAVVQFAGRRNEAGDWESTYDKEITLNNSTQMGKLKVMDFVEKEPKWSGWTLTAEAMEKIAQMVQTDARPNVAKYLIVLTDGRVTRDAERMKEAAKKLKELGVVNVAVAIGNDADEANLAIIANGVKKNIVKEADFKATADKFIESFVEKRCEGQ